MNDQGHLKVATIGAVGAPSADSHSADSHSADAPQVPVVAKAKVVPQKPAGSEILNKKQMQLARSKELETVAAPSKNSLLEQVLEYVQNDDASRLSFAARRIAAHSQAASLEHTPQAALDLNTSPKSRGGSRRTSFRQALNAPPGKGMSTRGNQMLAFLENVIAKQKESGEGQSKDSQVARDLVEARREMYKEMPKPDYSEKIARGECYHCSKLAVILPGWTKVEMFCSTKCATAHTVRRLEVMKAFKK
jgi:hypothetical protein